MKKSVFLNQEWEGFLAFDAKMSESDWASRFPHPPLREEGCGKSALDKTEAVGACVRRACGAVSEVVSRCAGISEINQGIAVLRIKAFHLRGSRQVLVRVTAPKSLPIRLETGKTYARQEIEELELANIEGGWKITAERELQVM